MTEKEYVVAMIGTLKLARQSSLQNIRQDQQMMIVNDILANAIAHLEDVKGRKN